jgi:hypothetical protein
VDRTPFEVVWLDRALYHCPGAINVAAGTRRENAGSSRCASLMPLQGGSAETETLLGNDKQDVGSEVTRSLSLRLLTAQHSRIT